MTTNRTFASNAQRQAAYRKRTRQAQGPILLSKGPPPLPAVSNVAGWSRWNKAIQQITELLEQMKSEMEDYYEERSERWLESAAAEAFREWMKELEEFIDQAPDWS